MKKYRVRIDQVKQAWVYVEAKNVHDAREEGYRKWCKLKEYDNFDVSYIELVCECNPHDIVL